MSRTLVGSNIRTRRQTVGMKQTELARAAGISPSYLNLIEHNRRGIAGKVLIEIAAALGLDAATLSEGADSELVRRLQLASALYENAVEIGRLHELIGRFPGWADLIAHLQRDNQTLRQTVDSLNDRLSQDPFLSESLHEILSSVTAVYATASILSEAPEMDTLQRRRFQSNILQESRRLSDLSQALVDFFDRAGQGEKTFVAPRDEVAAFLERNDFNFPGLEESATGGDDGVAAIVRASNDLQTRAGRHLAAALLSDIVQDARAMPLEACLKIGKESDFCPLVMARHFSVPPERAFRRLAFLPAQRGAPAFGLVVCDGSGAVLLRKSITGFAVPRYAPPCSLWPLYQALSRPHAMLRTVMETPQSHHFTVWTQASYLDGSDPDRAPIIRSAMLFRALAPDAAKKARTEPLAVGPTCRQCPRKGCAARREPSIHARVA